MQSLIKTGDVVRTVRKEMALMEAKVLEILVAPVAGEPVEPGASVAVGEEMPTSQAGQPQLLLVMFFHIQEDNLRDKMETSPGGSTRTTLRTTLMSTRAWS